MTEVIAIGASIRIGNGRGGIGQAERSPRFTLQPHQNASRRPQRSGMTPLVVPGFNRPLALCETCLSAASARLESVWGSVVSSVRTKSEGAGTSAKCGGLPTLMSPPQNVKNDGFADAGKASFIAARNRPVFTFPRLAGQWFKLNHWRLALVL